MANQFSILTKRPNIKSESGAAALILIVLTLTVAIAISFGVFYVLFSQMSMSIDAGQSVAAFYAADAGAEKCLAQIRHPEANSGPCNSPGGAISLSTLDNGASYKVTRGSGKSLISTGYFSETSRKV